MQGLTLGKSKPLCLLVSVFILDRVIMADVRYSVVQDSYTDGGGNHDGSPLAPPVIIPPNAEAGGRSTNGKLWIENIADDIGAKLMDYAVSSHIALTVSTETVSQTSSAVTNLSLWPSNPKPVDFLGESECSPFADYDRGFTASLHVSGNIPESIQSPRP